MRDPITMSRNTGRDSRRVLDAELISELRHLMQTQTELTERLAGQTINHVLEVFSAVFDATGIWARDYSVAAGSVYVANLGIAGHLVTVSSGTPSSGSTPSGTGTFLVDGGTARTVPVASRTVTLYGTAGDRFSVAVFTAAVVPGTP